MTASLSKLLAKPWIWSYIGALLVWLAAILFTRGYGAGGMVTAALSLAVFMVVVGVGQMFVISLGPGNVDLSLPANIGLASAVAMKVMAGDDGLVAIGLLAALFCGLAIGTVNYLLIWRALSASFIIQSIDIGFGRGLQIKPPTGFADFTNIQTSAFRFLPSSPCSSPPALVSRCSARRTAALFSPSDRICGQRGSQESGWGWFALPPLGGLDGALLAGYFRGANVDIGNEYLLASIAVVVIGGTSVAGGKANVPGIWGAALFLVLLLTMLNTFGASAGVRLLLTGLIIVGVITAAGGKKALD
jgi:ribose transport system permease protein